MATASVVDVAISCCLSVVVVLVAIQCWPPTSVMRLPWLILSSQYAVNESGGASFRG